MIEFYKEGERYKKDKVFKLNKHLTELFDKETLSQALNSFFQKELSWEITLGDFIYFIADVVVLPQIREQIIVELLLNDSQIDKGLPPRIFGNIEFYIEPRFSELGSHQVHLGEISCSERGKWMITPSEDEKIYSEDEK